MENINEIARLIQRGMESSATATRAVMQAIQLGYTLAEMEHQEKKAGCCPPGRGEHRDNPGNQKQR